MSVLETDYPHQEKVALENTYGMHLYTKGRNILCGNSNFLYSAELNIKNGLQEVKNIAFIDIGHKNECN